MSDYNLTKSDFDFLIDLQHEMLTQDTVCQAAPRYWTIAGNQKIYVGEDYAEGEELVYNGEDNCGSTLKEVVDYFINDIDENTSDLDKYRYVIEQDDNYKFEAYKITKVNTEYTPEDLGDDYIEGNEIEEEADCLTEIWEIVEALNDMGYLNQNDYGMYYYRDTHYVYPDTMFLTYRGAKKHLDCNSYHYDSEAHPYAMTAWRSTEVETLWNILDKIDWKKMKEDAYGRDESGQADKEV